MGDNNPVQDDQSDFTQSRPLYEDVGTHVLWGVSPDSREDGGWGVVLPLKMLRRTPATQTATYNTFEPELDPFL